MINVTSEAVQVMEDTAKKTIGCDEITDCKWNSNHHHEHL